MHTSTYPQANQVTQQEQLCDGLFSDLRMKYPWHILLFLACGVLSQASSMPPFSPPSPQGPRNKAQGVMRHHRHSQDLKLPEVVNFLPSGSQAVHLTPNSSTTSGT